MSNRYSPLNRGCHDKILQRSSYVLDRSQSRLVPIIHNFARYRERRLMESGASDVAAFAVAASFRRTSDRADTIAWRGRRGTRVTGKRWKRPFCHGRQTGWKKSASGASQHAELRRRNNDVEIAPSDARPRAFVARRYRDASQAPALSARSIDVCVMRLQVMRRYRVTKRRISTSRSQARLSRTLIAKCE